MTEELIFLISPAETRFLTYVRNDKYAIIFVLSTLTPPSNRNPQGVTLPRYLRLIAAGAVEASL